MNDRELATVLAALRFFQEESLRHPTLHTMFREHFEDHPVLTAEEIDDLCIQLNTNGRTALTFLHLDTKYGEDYFLFNNPNLADELLNAYVRNFWPRWFNDIPMPEDINDAVEKYFEMRQCAWYTIDDVVPLHTLDEVQKTVEEF